MITDIHIHILPGIDDGAQTWEDSIEMAEMAADSGVGIIAATIHGNLPARSYTDDIYFYAKRLEQFRQLLKSKKIGLTVCPGTEICAQGDFLERLQAGELLTLNRSRYPLVEFPMNVPAMEIYHTLHRIRAAGYVPVLAHPERYECVQKMPEHIYEWYRDGTVIQVNKGSILGSFGRKTMKTAKFILNERLADIVASDAHAADRRTPDMETLKEYLNKYYGKEKMELLLSVNPYRVLCDQTVVRDKKVSYGDY